MSSALAWAMLIAVLAMLGAIILLPMVIHR